MLRNEEFFNGVSGFYDRMTNFDTALVNRRKALEGFITPSMKQAADMGCGTGMDSISMALSGLKVTSFDISQGMLNSAGEKAKQLALDINFVKSSVTEIAAEYFGKFDIAVSLGNTLANVKESELPAALERANKLLRPDGLFVMQILNYDALVADKERIVSITENGGQYFVRFYDILNEGVQFNILSFESANPSKRSLVSTMLYPHPSGLLEDLLIEAGFKNIQKFGNLNKSPFNTLTSKDLVITANR